MSMLQNLLMSAVTGTSIGALLAEVASAADVPRDVATWLQTGGVVSVLLWVVWQQRADRKEQERRYDLLVDKHEKVTQEATAALREVSVAMARVRDEVQDMSQVVMRCNKGT